MNRDLKVSVSMAIAMGILLPLAETLRRFKQLTDPASFLSWFDDYILGGFLVAAAVMVIRKAPRALGWLIAAWGVATGALFLSFLGQFEYFHEPKGDPGGMFSVWLVLVAKGLILAYMVVGMRKAVKGQDAADTVQP